MAFEGAPSKKGGRGLDSRIQLGANVLAPAHRTDDELESVPEGRVSGFAAFRAERLCLSDRLATLGGYASARGFEGIASRIETLTERQSLSALKAAKPLL